MIELSDLGMGRRGERKMMTDEEAVELLGTKNWKEYLALQRKDADITRWLKDSIKQAKGLATRNNELGNPVSEDDILKGQVGNVMEFMDWTLAKHEAWDRLEKRLTQLEEK